MDDANRSSYYSHTALSSGPSLAPPDTTQEVGEWLARYNQDADPGITASYLFPSETEIRLIHLDVNSPATEGGDPIAPFYFGPDRAGGVTYPSAIALIRPEEKEHLPLPEGWGTWDEATMISRKAN